MTERRLLRLGQTQINVRIQDTTGGWRLDGALVPGEIIDHATGDLVKEVGLQVGLINTVEVPEGSYSVRARFPGSQFVTVDASEKTDVTIPAPPSMHEYLSWETAAGQALPPARYITKGPRPPGETPWVQLWTTEPQPWLDSYIESDLTSWKITLGKPLEPGMHYVVTGTARGAQRVTALPVESNASITLRPVAPDVPQARGLEVATSISSDNASPEDRQVDSVLRYLTRGEIERSQLMVAERLMFNKLRNPTGAAVGGYLLLRSGDYRRLHNWPGNFESWKEYLPDAAIIHGLQMLWDPELRDLEAAAQSLLRATLLGPPLLTIGLEMLRQGLHVLARETEDSATEAARRMVQSYAIAADWNKPFTTFLGTTPTAPDPLAPPGVAKGQSHVEWLPRRSGWQPFPDPDSSTVIVTPAAGGGWRVQPADPIPGGGERFRTKAEAVSFARSKVPHTPSSRLVVLRKDHSTEHVQAWSEQS